MIGSTRRMAGTALALIAAVAAVWSAFIGWYGGRKGSDIRLQDLFNQMTLNKANTWASLFIPLGVSALLALAGVVVGRWLWVLGGLIALATTFLWGLRQAQTVTGMHASLMGNGPALAAGSGALMLIAAAVAGGRRSRAKGAEATAPDLAYDHTARHAAAGAPVASEVHNAPAAPEMPATPDADQWAGSGQAYQQGYEHGMGQAAEQGQTLDETLGQKRDG
jgi:hypothetical protein